MSHIEKRVCGFSKKAIISFVAMATFLSMTGIPYLAPIQYAQAAAPTFTLTWETGSNVILVTFDQWVFNSDTWSTNDALYGPPGELATQGTNFVVGGNGINTVMHTGGSKYAILLMDSNVTAGVTIACAAGANAIYNEGDMPNHANPVACDSGVTITTGGAGGAEDDNVGPSITSVNPMGSDGIEVHFDEPVDNSGTSLAIANFKLHTADGGDPYDNASTGDDLTATQCDIFRQPWDASMVMVDVWDAWVDPNSNADKIWVSDGVTDLFGNVNQTTGPQTIVFQTGGEGMPPYVKGANKVTGTTVDVIFSENMDPVSTEVTSFYTLTTAAGGTATVTGVTLNNDIATVTISGTTIAESGDTIKVAASASGAAPRDLDGMMQTDDWWIPIEKAAAPQISSVGADVATKKIFVTFDKAMDPSSTQTKTYYTVYNTGNGLLDVVDDAVLDWDNRTVKLTLTDMTGVVKLKVSSAPTDLQGQAQTTTDYQNIDATAPTVTKITPDLSQGANANIFDAADTVTIVFSETMDQYSVGGPYDFDILYGPYCDPDAYTNCNWGYWGDSASGVWNGAKTEYTITLGNYFDIAGGYNINPYWDSSGNYGVSDLAGNGVSNYGTIVISNPTMVSVLYTDDGGDGIGVADTFKITFSESMNTVAIDTIGEVNTNLPPKLEATPHSWGSDGTVSWSGATELTITLGATGLTVASGDVITPDAVVASVSGFTVSGTYTIDVAAPTMEIDSTGLTSITLLFNEAIANSAGINYKTGSAVAVGDFTFFDSSVGGVGISAITNVSSDGTRVTISLDGTIGNNDTIAPSGDAKISDINGNCAVANNIKQTVNTSGGYFDEIAPTISNIFVMSYAAGFSGAGTAIIGPGDMVRIKFSESIDPAGITSANLDTSMALSNSHTWGSGVFTWWESSDPAGCPECTDVLAIDVGSGSDVANGDIITPAGTVTDWAGNPVSGTGTIDSSVTRILSVVATDGTLAAGDHIVITFSHEMDATGILTTGNLDQELWLENASWTHHSWGTGGALDVAWTETTKANDTLTITLGTTGLTVADGDTFWVGGMVHAASGGHIMTPGKIDITSPTLDYAYLVYDHNDDNAVISEDVISFRFSEPMKDFLLRDIDTDYPTDSSVIRPTTIDSKLVPSSGSFGTDSRLEWKGPVNLLVTLQSTQADTIGATITPDASILDQAGNAINVGVTKVLTKPDLLPSPVTYTSDNDTTYMGIDGYDITLRWHETSTLAANFSHYDIYILPAGVPLIPYDSEDSNSHHPINSSPIYKGVNIVGYYIENGGPPGGIPIQEYNAGSSSYAIYDDSRFTYLNKGVPPDPGIMFYPLMDSTQYFVYVVVVGAGDAAGQEFSQENLLWLTGEYTQDTRSAFVEGCQPFDGQMDVPTNTTKLVCGFSGQMDQTSVESSGNITLKYGDAGSALNTSASITPIYDADMWAVILDLGGEDLVANKKYEIFISQSVASQGGVGLMSPYYSTFTAAAGGDTDPPRVMGSSTSSGAANVNTLTPFLGIGFSEPMDPASFTDNSVVLNPAVGGSTYWYDPMMGLQYEFGGQLADTQAYTLTLGGDGVKDAAGNYLDGDDNNVAGGNYVLTFTTGAEDITTAPKIMFSDADDYHMMIGFDAAMKESTVTSLSNWNLESPVGTVKSLSGVSVFYDKMMKEVHFDGLTLTIGETYQMTASANVKGINEVSISTGSGCKDMDGGDRNCNLAKGTAHGFFGGPGMMMEQGMTGPVAGEFEFGAGDVYCPDMMMFTPIDVFPMNPMEKQYSNYMVHFPIKQPINNGGQITLKFPALDSGFDISKVAMALAATESFMNQDINGPGGVIYSGVTYPNGVVTISNVAADTYTNTITLTLAVDYNTGGGDVGATTMANDFLGFELKDIKNGKASVMDFMSVATGGGFDMTGGYEIIINTKGLAPNNTSFTPLEGPMKSMRFPITKSGNGKISGYVTDSSGNIATGGIANAKVFLSGPMVHFETLTSVGTGGVENSKGKFSFTGLPTNISGTYYHLWVDPPTATPDYFADASIDIDLTDASPTVTGKIIKMSSADSTISGTITHANITGDVMIWTAGPNGWKDTKQTLDGDGSTEYSVTVRDGDWDIGIEPYFPKEKFMMGPPPASPFVPPSSQWVTVSTTKADVDFILTKVDKTITGTVKDQNGVGLPGAHVWAYSPNMMGPGMNMGAESQGNGSFSIPAVTGIYKVGTHIPGMPNVPPEIQVVVNTDGTTTPATVAFVFSKPNATIQGTVLDVDGNAIPYSSVSAYDTTGKWVSAIVSENSKQYNLYVDAGTWTIEANAPGYGFIQPATGVDVSDIVVVAGDNLTGKNFQIATADFNKITGYVKDASGTGVSTAMVWADEYNISTGMFIGKGNGTPTNEDGSFSLNVPKNISGTTLYSVGGHVPGYGELQEKRDIDISAGNATANWTLAETKTLTISFSNVPANFNPTHTAAPNTLPEASIDVFNTSAFFGNHTRIENAISTTMSIQNGTYEAHAYIPGYGDIPPSTYNGVDISSENSFTVSGTTGGTLIFNLSDISGTQIRLQGFVKNAAGTAIPDAWVHLFNFTSGRGNGMPTDSATGAFDIMVPDIGSDYELVADMPGYISSVPEIITESDANKTITLTQATSTIQGVVYQSDQTTLAPHSHVWAEKSGGGFTSAPTNHLGAFTLDVDAGSTWNVFAGSDKGYEGQKMGITAGTPDLKIYLTNTIPAFTLFAVKDTFNDTVVPDIGSTINDFDDTGVKLTIEAGDLGDSLTPFSVEFQPKAGLKDTANYTSFGGAGVQMDIKEPDAMGRLIEATVSQDIAVEYKMTDTEIEAIIGVVNNEVPAGSQFDYLDLDKLELGYWEEANGNGMYITEETTHRVKVDKDDENGLVYEKWDTFIDNVDDSNGTGSPDHYKNYEVYLRVDTKEFTVRGPIVPTDIIPPAIPTSAPVAVAGDSSVSLTWTYTQPVDFYEYEIYRNTSAAFPATQVELNALQINPPGVSVIAKSYTDGTAVNGQTYYYVYTAVDTSGNGDTPARVSPISVSVTPVAGADDTVVSGTTVISGGGGGAPAPAPAPAVAMPTTATGEVTATAAGGGKTSVTTTENVKVEVRLPANAVSVSTEVAIAPVEISETALETAPVVVVSAVAAVPVTKTVVGGNVYNMTASSGGVAVSEFSKYVTITLTYTNAQIIGLKESSLTINYWDETGEEWIELDTTVNKTSNKLTAKTLHFTYFGIMGEEGIDIEDGEDLVIYDGQEIVIGGNAIAIAQVRYQIKEIIKQLIVLITELITVYQAELLELQE